jgi:hypothetical protein
MDEALEKKLRETIDRQEIWHLMQRYGRGLDRIDRELLRGCYWDDCIEDHDSLVGTVDEFIDWALASSKSFVECHHGLMNHYVELDGDNAYGETYYLFIGYTAQPPHFMSMGRYIDHYQRRNGEWRFANRITIIEKNYDLAESKSGEGHPTSYGPHERQHTSKDRDDVSYQRPPRPRRPKKLSLQ